MNHTLTSFLAVSALAAAAPLAILAGNDYVGTPRMGSATTAASAQAEFTVGEVKKIYSEQHKVTIKHGPLENLGMPAMTMVFRLANPAMLGKIKVGDTIKFKADKIDGAFTVVELQPGA